MPTEAGERKYPSHPFRELHIDGVAYVGPAIIDRLTELFKEKDAEWLAPLLRTIDDLVIAEGSLAARSSGTTGPPKEFRIPPHDLLNSALLTGATFGLHPGDRVLHCLPCDFIAGKMMVVRAFVLGLDIHFIPPRNGVLAYLGTNDRSRFTAMVPKQLANALGVGRALVESHFEMVLLGGGPVSKALYDAVQGLSTAVFESYGSTETVTHVAVRPLNEAAISSFGSPSDREVAPFKAIGEVHFGRDPRGCLVVHTPHLSVAQHVTNDLVDLIDEEHFNWLGRFDHVILSGGRKIHPEQLERRTNDVLPYPHYFTSTPDDVLGQAVLLVLETEREEAEVMPEVMEMVMGVLKPHEWPRRVQVLPRIQRTNSGKPIRR